MHSAVGLSTDATAFVSGAVLALFLKSPSPIPVEAGIRLIAVPFVHAFLVSRHRMGRVKNDQEAGSLVGPCKAHPMAGQVTGIRRSTSSSVVVAT